MTLWMIWASVVTILIAAAAASVEWALRVVGQPVRSAWMVAAVGSLGLMAWSVRAATPAEVPTSTGGELQTVAADLLKELAAGVGPAQQAFLQRADDLVALGWVTASTMLVVTLAFGLWRLSRRARSWTRAVVDGREVLVSRSFGPALIGVLSPRIVVPRWALHLGRERLRMACLHEAEHRRGKDGLLLLGSALVVAAAPWNPGLWWIHARLRAAVEIDCDARVLRAGARPVPYGALLLDLSARALDVPRLVAAFTRPKTNLERRMTMIVRDRAPRGAGDWSRAAGAVALGALLVVAACRAPTPTDVGAAAADATSSSTLSPAERASHSASVAGSVVRMPDGDEGGTFRLRAHEPHLEGREEGTGDVVWLREDESGARALHLDRGPVVERPSESASGASAGRTVRIRGSGTVRLEGGSEAGEPLIYVDGIRVAEGGRGLLDELNPDRVERVEILKGPAAVAMYGSEAAAGVIQIFLKEVAEPRQ